MNASSLAKILKTNALLEQHQQRLNQTKGLASLSSFLHDEQDHSFAGTCDAMTDLLEKRKNLLLEKNALLQDILFILHHSIRSFLESDLSDQEKTEIIHALEENKLKIEQRCELLKNLEAIYLSIMIEPASVAIPDGEKEDPTRFRVVIDPQPSLSAQQGTDLLNSWQQQISSLETTMDTILQLQKLPEYALAS
ncbi:MAG: hypothetical protein JSS62_00625 [Verrucomicrobia bacterium]|nr:hypothetical protein [Verrucomicrobiota bacterium]MBS0646637.1 hypothetical protein [Verrucomicrobiota bacterium]